MEWVKDLNWHGIILTALILTCWQLLSYFKKAMERVDSGNDVFRKTGEVYIPNGFIERQIFTEGWFYYTAICFFGLLFISGFTAFIMILGYGFIKFMSLTNMQKPVYEIAAILGLTVIGFIAVEFLANNSDPFGKRKR
jgi:uncharacterized BrkB/YihY/UPF0761 family membrane protein